MNLPLLPTTMVGSYPRPSWFTQQLQGRDLLDALKDRRHHEVGSPGTELEFAL